MAYCLYWMEGLNFLIFSVPGIELMVLFFVSFVVKVFLVHSRSYLTNRFHFAVRLYSDNAQMTSKRGENKEVRYEPQASSVTDLLTTF